MSPVRLRCGVRIGAIVCGLAGIVLASIHFAGDGFSEVVVATGVLGVILVAGIWLMAEWFYILAESEEQTRAEVGDRYDTLQAGRTDAEAIAARAFEVFDRHGHGEGTDDGAVVGINGRRRR